ncbi:MAG: hypothetical protein QNJ72_41500 [Pleurocapsa sp. MO_226.B13]|nr:hypothetical protein [Pleurocapsa sp. MO_226.B13]
MKIYAYKDTGYFATIAEIAIANSNFLEVPSLPPHGNHRWDGSKWIALTDLEIEATAEEPAEGEIPQETGGVELPDSVEDNSLVVWNKEGSEVSLADSNLTVSASESRLNSPYSLNVVQGDYLIDGVSITAKERQIAIATEEQEYDQTSWQQIPGLKLISRNLAQSSYTIAIELLVKVDKNERDFEFALFINGEQQEQDTLDLHFAKKNDDKSLTWSNDYELDPESVVSLSWRSSGNSCKATAGRRKLTLIQHQPTGLAEPIVPEEEEQEQSDWLFLGEGGIDFSHGNGANKDIRYRSSMSLVRDSSGIYFSGASPFAAWVKFEFLRWSRGEGKTLKIVFAATQGICQVGIGSDEVNENSNGLYFASELAIYLNQNNLFSLLGNRGKPWQGTQTTLNIRVSSNYHRLEIENDGTPGSNISVFDLPDGNSENWDDSNEPLYQGAIGQNHSADSPNIMPFFIPQDGSGFKIIAVQVI